MAARTVVDIPDGLRHLSSHQENGFTISRYTDDIAYDYVVVFNIATQKEERVYRLPFL